MEIVVRDPAGTEADDAGTLPRPGQDAAILDGVDDDRGDDDSPAAQEDVATFAILSSGCGCQQTPDSSPLAPLFIAAFIAATLKRTRPSPPPRRKRV